MMVAQNQDPHRTAYAVTCDYKHGEPPSARATLFHPRSAILTETRVPPQIQVPPPASLHMTEP